MENNEKRGLYFLKNKGGLENLHCDCCSSMVDYRCTGKQPPKGLHFLKKPNHDLVTNDLPEYHCECCALKKTYKEPDDEVLSNFDDFLDELQEDLLERECKNDSCTIL